jgi:type IV pilus assembly protein PilE
MAAKDLDVRGFTLIELMVIIAVLATITMVAYPTYMSYVRESGRGDAYSALFDLATRQEHYFTTYNTYTDTIVSPPDCAGPSCGLGTSDLSPDGYYALSAAAGKTRDLATSFVLTARARSGFPQEDDERCSVLTINSLGETAPAECW